MQLTADMAGIVSLLYRIRRGKPLLDFLDPWLCGDGLDHSDITSESNMG
jgi:hypothetical protein